MVCLGVVFGCRHSSVESYALLALVVIGFIVAFRIICYSLYRLLKYRSRDEQSSSRDDEDDDHGVELQAGNHGLQAPQRSCMGRTLPETKLVIPSAQLIDSQASPL